MSDLSHYQNFFNTMSQIQNTGMPVVSNNYVSGYVSPTDILGMMDLNVGQASLGDIARYSGMGDAMNIGWNRFSDAVSNSKFAKAYGDMPFTDKVNAGIGLLGTVGGLYNGWNTNKLMKDQLNFQKQAFNKQYQASVNQYNTSLEDRQRARVASNPNAYQSVSDYMNQHRMK